MRKQQPEGADITEVVGATTSRAPAYRTRTTCRLCWGTELRRVLDLPATPLANEFPRERRTADIRSVQEEFPLYLVSCAKCGHVQLPVVVDPERLFREYVYVSGTSPVFVDHFARYADEVIAKRGLQPGDLVVDIGSNDGTLLRFFQKRGMQVLGIDPAVEIARKVTESGIETWPKFFDGSVIERILGERGAAKLVVANNVFAHADDLEGFALGVKELLAPGGAFVFEVSYLVDVLRHTLFDTIYHEHLSYHSLSPLFHFFDRLGMSVVDAKRVDTHGGSIRVTVEYGSRLPFSDDAKALLDEEALLFLDTNPKPIFHSFSGTIATRLIELRREIGRFKDSLGGSHVAGYGAPAKATTLIRTFGIEELLDFVVDDSPWKQGRYLPGGKLRVVPIGALDRGASPGWLRGEWPSAVVILAWNFAESIANVRLASYRATGGACIVPLPTVRTIT